MADVIQHKRSSTAGAVPGTGDLSPGELAVNTADAKVYAKRDSGDVVLINPDRNIDGGAASSVYLSGQVIDGGGASG